ncbi:peptide/nickel transport system ATP-binding protein [Stella humosa]|uniref:Peptide/nickel transport system ATP-binding protein n=1 Tax=Stella humosa TaxID=94 RepID=A0A3N1MEN3_9PROT|nr:ABC transporter ATP-binding protein [Stella humosa]ROP99635.1 peptide/nickel transport system ATP-binding protein [Stella humosa]BBK31140.1 ABC transporter ATP-binding protein [Stella humosa]
MLQIRGLDIPLPGGGERRFAVRGLSLDVAPGELVCIVGESGSGKSLTARAVMGLLPDMGLRASAGTITFKGENLLALPQRRMEGLRGREISMIFQEPMTALNPLMRVGDQISELFRIHRSGFDKAERQRRVLSLLADLNLPDPARIAEAYPFEMSGGQRQRVMIAIAFALGPSLLIADEPTTALDVTTQMQILRVLKRLQAERGTAVIFITHDFGVVAEIADRVAVMWRGELVEQGPARAVLGAPAHAYTKALIDSVPRLSADARAERAAPTQPPVLSVAGLSKIFRVRKGMFGAERKVEALKQVSFTLHAGETLAVVGESGSGKTTLSRCIVRLMRPDAGRIDLFGEDMGQLAGGALRARRKAIQMVFQDPHGSLNPRIRVGPIIMAGPLAHGVKPAAARATAERMLGLVGLDAGAMDRYPHQFSGGQRQRIGLARALALEPLVLIADEPVSALDVTVQAQILDLLRDVREKLGLAMIFITHDLRVAGQVADRIAVMRQGEIVEEGTPAAIMGSARHEYTRQLVAAIPGRRLI